MATLGQVNTNTLDNSFFWVYWSQVSQDIANNKTTIYWSCGVTCGHNYYSNAIEMSAVRINGEQVYGGGKYSNFSKGERQIASGYMDIIHDGDGTKTLTISPFSGWLYANNDYRSDGGSFELPSIPRAASITDAPDFNDTDKPTITYSNPAGDAVDSLMACISFTGEKDDIAYRDISKTGSSYQFVLTEEERDVLRDGTTGTERNVLFFVRSKIGNNTYYSYLTRKLTIAESDATRPYNVQIETAPVNDLIPDEYRDVFSGIYIQGKSKVSVKISASAKYGATIKNYSSVVDGMVYASGDFTSAVIRNSGDVWIYGYANDTRDFVGSNSKKIEVIEYSKPLVEPISHENAILCYRSDEYGNRDGAGKKLWIKAKRSYHIVSGKNTCALQWRWKGSEDQWPDDDTWHDLLLGTDTSNEYNASVEGEFALYKAYTIQIRAKDDIGEYDIKTLDIPTRDVALHLGAGGKKVSVGSYCGDEDYTFHSEWKAIFDQEVIIGGKQLVNFVVEEGTSGIWTYRKWADGTAECWGKQTGTVTCASAWGSLFYGVIAGVNFPQYLFKEAPVLIATMENRNVFITKYDVTYENTGNVAAISAYPETDQPYSLHYTARGRW